MNSDRKLLRLENVVSGYGKMMVIQDITLRVKQGELVTILGSNGVGKTTTLRTILGQVVPKKGTVSFAQKDITQHSPHERVRLGISYCPEGRDIFGNLSVIENLRAGGYLIPSKKKYKKRLEFVFSLFPRLEERQKQIAESLSGGEQQMLAMGRALINEPTLLLLDEPSLGLAPQLVDSVTDTVTEINQSGVSILLVEQNARVALNIAQYAYVMEKGNLALEGPASELRENEKIQEVYLGVS